jgi:hypothetical protein
MDTNIEENIDIDTNGVTNINKNIVTGIVTNILISIATHIAMIMNIKLTFLNIFHSNIPSILTKFMLFFSSMLSIRMTTKTRRRRSNRSTI